MLRTAFAVLLGFAVLQGCAGPLTSPGSTHPPVPPVRAEAVPAPPPSRVTLIWQPGHYDWTGSSYVWLPGEWVDRAGHGSLWQDGFWQVSGLTTVWVPAHWM